MACRISSAHVCQIAKSVVLQAKDTSANHLLKPGSRELSRVRCKNKELSSEKHISKESKQDLPENTDPEIRSNFKRCDVNQKNCQRNSVIDNEISPNNIFDYFRKLYDEEESSKLCLHLQPSNIKPFGSCGNQYNPTIFKRRSSSADCQYFSKSVGEKIESASGKLSTSHSNCIDLHSNNQNMRASVLDDVLMKRESDVSQTFGTRIFSAPEPASSKHSEGDSRRFISSFEELLEEKSIQAKGSNNKSQSKLIDHINGTQGDLSIVSTKPSNPKLFGSRFNRSPLIGPQYLQDNYANLRSVCGVIRTNDSCAKVTIKKITKKKKTLPKLTLMKCPSIAASLTKMKNVTIVPLKKQYVPQDPVRICEIEEKEICKRADDDWKLTAKPFGKIADCPKISSTVEMKCSAPLSRLPKVEIPEPSKKCEQPVIICAPRSDATLSTTKRELPQIPCGTFCRPPLDVVAGEPIRRLKKFSFKDIPRVCPKEEIICKRIKPEVKPKCLPELILKCPPPPEGDKMMDCKKLKRLPPRKVEVVPRPCPKAVVICDTPRADDNSKFVMKKLPKYEPNKCKMKSFPSELKEGDILQRPQKHYDPKDPIRKCKTFVKCVKEPIQVEQKILPKVEYSGQATFPQMSLREGVPIKRMEKKKYLDPERICPVKEVCDKTKRADAKLLVKKSYLPRLHAKCAAPPKYIPELKKSPLKRLPKVILAEPKKVCPSEQIVECVRSDNPYTQSRKSLPILQSKECSLNIQLDEIRDPPALKRLIPKKIIQTRECPTKIQEKCVRSDMDDWDYIIERSCYPIQDKCRQKNSGNVNTKRSMSTNLSSQLNKGLLHRRAQLSHIDLRKRFSNRSGILEGETRENIMKAEIHSSSPKYCDKDPLLEKDLQPRYPLYTTFEGLDPIKPEAPQLDPSLEDDCIREKYKIPYEGVTATCENPNAKRKFLRVQKNGRSENNASSCTEEVVKSCSSATGVSASSCDEVVKSCPSTSTPPCPKTFSPKHPCPPPCPPICTRPKSCPKFKGVCGKKASLWQRIKNYFKARPNCPPPGAYKKKKLMKKVKKMADRAGLGVYDPCDDPKLICKEVERRCCLAKKSNCMIGRRCLHTFGAFRIISSISPFVGILPINERIIERILILNRRTAHLTAGSHRKMSSWRNPYEFYNFEREYDGDNLAMCSSGAQEEYCTSDSKSQHLFETCGGIDMDLLKEKMFKILFIKPLISSNMNDEEFEVEGCPSHDSEMESIQRKKELLIEILHKIQQNLETISKKNLINWDEKDSTQKTIKVLGKILDSKQKR